MIKNSSLKRFAAATGTALLIAGGAMAGDDYGKLVIDDKNPICKEDPGFCRIFNYSTLYKNENACFVQKVALTGRYHGQYLNQGLDYHGFRGFTPLPTGMHEDYWEHRRFRLGTKVQFLNDFTFYNEWNIADNHAFTNQRFFSDIDVMGIEWEPTDDFYVNVGKQKAKITREFSTSSKNILTFERSHIVNEVIASQGKPWGVTVGFKALGLKHELGGWLTGADIHAPRQEGYHWPDFDSRGALSYRTAYGITDHTDLHFDYLFTNNSDGRAPFGGGGRNLNGGAGRADRLEASNYNHVIAIGTDSAWDIDDCGRQFGFITDFIWGIDREPRGGTDAFDFPIPGGAPRLNDRGAGEDTFGIVLMPHYDLTERLQVVGRYAYASQSRLHRTQRRVHEQNPYNGVFDDRPNLEDVHTFYLGLNYRLCGDKLKLMAGYEYLTADLENTFGGLFPNPGAVTGNSWMLGVRTYW